MRFATFGCDCGVFGGPGQCLEPEQRQTVEQGFGLFAQPEPLTARHSQEFKPGGRWQDGGFFEQGRQQRLVTRFADQYRNQRRSIHDQRGNPFSS